MAGTFIRTNNCVHPASRLTGRYSMRLVHNRSANQQALRVPSEASLAEPDPNEARGGSRVIHLYIWPTTERQVVAPKFGTSETARFHARQAGVGLKRALMVQIRQEKGKIVLNKFLSPIGSKNALFDAFPAVF